MALQTVQGESVRRNPDFYFDDLVTIRVENELFRLPVRLLTKHSPLFRDMLELGGELRSTSEGQSDDNPIVLPDKLDEFTVFVSCFYDHERPKFLWRTKSELVSMLKFSHKYQMDSVKNMVTGSLYIHPFEAIELLQLTDSYDIPLGWASAAIEALCKRGRPLSVKETQLFSPAFADALSHTIWSASSSQTAQTPLELVAEMEKMIRSPPEFEDSALQVFPRCSLFK